MLANAITWYRYTAANRGSIQLTEELAFPSKFRARSLANLFEKISIPLSLSCVSNDNFSSQMRNNLLFYFHLAARNVDSNQIRLG